MTSIRRLAAAILAADVAGYWRLMGADEEGRTSGSRRISASWLIRRSRSIAVHREEHWRRNAGGICKRDRRPALWDRVAG